MQLWREKGRGGGKLTGGEKKGSNRRKKIDRGGGGGNGRLRMRYGVADRVVIDGLFKRPVMRGIIQIERVRAI